MIKNHMLLLEDDSDMCRNVISILQDGFPDYDYDGAKSFEEGKKKLRNARIRKKITRVVIVDEELEGKFRGSDFLKYIHTHYPGIKKIMLAAMAEPEDLSKALNDGHLDKYILKDDFESDNSILIKAVDEAMKEDNGFIYDAITKVLQNASIDKRGLKPILVAGKKKFTPSQLLQQITMETKFGRKHMSNFSEFLYKIFINPQKALDEMNKIGKTLQKSESKQIKVKK